MTGAIPDSPAAAQAIETQTWPRSSIDALLDAARSAGVLSALDQQFSSRLTRHYGEASVGVGWALALASRQESAGARLCGPAKALFERLGR